MSAQHAFLGLGAMGGGMALNLAAKGKLEKPLLLWNRTTSKATALAEQPEVRDGSGAEVASSHVDAITRATVVWACFYDQKAAEDVWFNAAVDADLKGTIVVESTTMSAEGTNAIAQRVQNAGGQFVAMPGKLCSKRHTSITF